MSITALLKRNTVKTKSDGEDDTPYVHPNLFQWLLNETPAKYDREHEIQFNFTEQVSIRTTEDDDFATFTIDTIFDDVDLSIRINNYTTRFGTLDATFITVSGLAIVVYYEREDSDQYFARRVFFSEGGVSSERIIDSINEPYEPDWTRDDIGEEIITGLSKSHIEVYDWHQNMITSNIPTPQEGEVVVMYTDSTQGTSRQEHSSLKLQTDDLPYRVTETLHTQPVAEDISITPSDYTTHQEITVNFIRFDTDTLNLHLFGLSEDYCWEGRIPITTTTSQVCQEDIDWECVDSLPRPSDIDDLVWVRDAAHTWSVNPDRFFT